MKVLRVKVKPWNMGVVVKDDNYVGLLSEGTHWLPLFSEVIEYDMAKPFVSTLNLNVLLADKAFAEATIYVEVKDNEIALKYENGFFAGVMTPGRYVYWKGLVNYDFVVVDLNSVWIDERVDKAILKRRELAPYIRTYIVEASDKGILYIDGKINGVLEAGVYYFWNNQTEIVVRTADMRAVQLEISGQEILTKDKASVRLNCFVQYNVTDIMVALGENKDYDKQLYVMIQLALREFVGAYTIDEMLEKKDNVSEYVINGTAERAAKLGVVVSACGIRDVILPGDMKDIMNQVLVAEKKAQANTIMRREETASTRSLLNTAKLMEENAMLFKLKEMEYVERIAERIDSISLSGGGQLVDQMKQIFSTERK